MFSKYRCSFHDRFDLAYGVKSEAEALSFSISKDLLNTSGGTVLVDKIPTNINLGDWIVIRDGAGLVLSTNIIVSYNDNVIEFEQPLSLFNFDWDYQYTENNNVELNIKSIINNFVNDSDVLVNKVFKDFDIEVKSSSYGKFEKKEVDYVTNLETFIYSLYKKYDVKVSFIINYNQGKPKIIISKVNLPVELLADNNQQVRSIDAEVEVFETNKLIIYNEDKTVLRGIFYTSNNGITTNYNEPTRPKVIKTRYVFNTDDSVDLIKAQNIRNEIYNHKINVIMAPKGNLYNFWEWELGQQFKIFHNKKYYNSVLTGYEIKKEQNSDIQLVELIFGKVRVTLEYSINNK